MYYIVLGKKNTVGADPEMLGMEGSGYLRCGKILTWFATLSLWENCIRICHMGEDVVSASINCTTLVCHSEIG
jgi:hypothetical protein